MFTTSVERSNAKEGKKGGHSGKSSARSPCTTVVNDSAPSATTCLQKTHGGALVMVAF